MLKRLWENFTTAKFFAGNLDAITILGVLNANAKYVHAQYHAREDGENLMID